MDDHKYKNQFWGYSVKTSVRKTGRTAFTEKSPVSMSAAVVNDEYNGQFKVINATGDDGVFRVRVVNGADQDGEFCGITDVGSVNSAILTPKSTDRYVILKAAYNSETKKYNQEVALNEYSLSGITMYTVLAQINPSTKKIVQEWIDGTIYWSTRYYV